MKYVTIQKQKNILSKSFKSGLPTMRKTPNLKIFYRYFTFTSAIESSCLPWIHFNVWRLLWLEIFFLTSIKWIVQIFQANDFKNNYGSSSFSHVSHLKEGSLNEDHALQQNKNQMGTHWLWHSWKSLQTVHHDILLSIFFLGIISHLNVMVNLLLENDVPLGQVL